MLVTGKKVLLPLLVLGSMVHGALLAQFSCEANVPDFPVDINKLAGTWYEVARLPEVAVPACVSVDAAANYDVINDSYSMSINFIDNVNNGWHNESEVLTFPWSTQVSKGIFELKYGKEPVTVTMTYRIMETDYSNIAMICGYSSLSTAASFLKVLSRERLVSESSKKQLEAFVAQYEQSGLMIGWVEQGERCNGAAILMPVLAILMTGFHVIFWRY